MSYFDSPKNQALWEKELDGLDAEKERRKSEGYKPGQKITRISSVGNKNAEVNSLVRVINLNELIEIERLSRESETNGKSIRKEQPGRVQEHRKPEARSIL